MPDIAITAIAISAARPPTSSRAPMVFQWKERRAPMSACIDSVHRCRSGIHEQNPARGYGDTGNQIRQGASDQHQEASKLLIGNRGGKRHAMLFHGVQNGVDR